MDALSLIDNAALQGLAYGFAVLGVVLSFRIVRYPDLTPDGSFLLGSSAYAAAAASGAPFSISIAAAIAAGAAAGVITSLLHSGLGINRLLSGILTTMMAYSIGYRVMGGRPNVGLGEADSIFDLGASLDARPFARELNVHPGALLVLLVVAAVVSAGILHLLRSEWGLLLRATGNRAELVAELQRRPWRYQLQGLALANGIIGLSAALVSARQGFVDVNMGAGVVVMLIAALAIGEGLLRLAGLDAARDLRGRIPTAFIGATVYFLLYLAVLRASIRGWLPVTVKPTDLKLLSALVVIVAVSLRLRARVRDEVLPL